MKVLIIEDELPAARRLRQLIAECEPKATVLDTVDSVEDSVKWLKYHPKPDLIFMDIQLSDGVSFSIFDQIEVVSPVIFTTAFDQYTLKAFKVKSVDYLLKPIEVEELAFAIEQYHLQFPKEIPDYRNMMEQLMANLHKPTYKNRFMLKSGKHYTYLTTEEIACFQAEEGVVFAFGFDGKRYLLENTLETIENQTDPGVFFRISRNAILNIACVKEVHSHFNGRLKLVSSVSALTDLFVSRSRVQDFKKWLG